MDPYPMENQTLGDTPAETRLNISTNLLETPQVTPDLNRTEMEFLHQNEILNQEMRKYDNRLSTCWMIVFKTCLVLYMISIFFAVDQLAYFLIMILKDNMSALAWGLRIFYLLKTLVLVGLFYGCILFWSAASSKDLFKIEKCIFIFKTCFIFSIVFNVIDIALGFVKYPSWGEMFFGVLCRLGYAGINYVVALYVKRVLLKRDVYQQVSSYPIK